MAGTTFSTVEEYDPETDTWTTKSPLPEARWGHSAVTLNGKIYVIGGASGWAQLKYLESIEEYNPETDTWTTRDSIPTPRWLLSCSVVNGKIYAIGGYGEQEDTTVPTVEVYEPENERAKWRLLTPMPTARWAITTSVVNGKIYAIGCGDLYTVTTCY